MTNEHKDLRDLRREAGISQQSLASLMRVALATISRWENGRRRITAENAVKIEKVTDGKISRRVLRPDIFGVENEYTVDT